MSNAYTRVPQWFFGLVPELSDMELRIMLVIYRHTLGWNRDFDSLSYSQLQHETGISSRNAITKALKSLESRGLITRQTTRITAQRVQVYPLVPVLPRKLVSPESMKSSPNVPAVVSPESMKSSPNIPAVVSPEYSQKKQPKKLFKETNTIEKLSESQEESLALMVAGGVDEEISRRLILLAWSRGRDSEYISRIVGYAALEATKNPPGLIVSLIERNNDRIRPPASQQGPGKSFEVPTYHLYDEGGPELVSHPGKREDCEICSKGGD